MDPVSFLLTALQIIRAGGEAITVASQAMEAMAQPGGPTQADWDALHAAEAALRIRLAADPRA